MTSTGQPLRILFAGTPDFAAYHLQVLLDAIKDGCNYSIVGVYTQPDRPAGRGKKLTRSAVKKLALENSLPIYQPLSLKDETAQAELASLDADLMIVVAYGLILPKSILDTPRHGCINVHGSLLPRWRGAAPIQRAILGDKSSPEGDRKTGVTIMKMDIGLDTGDMLLKCECDIAENETTVTLHDKLMHLGGDALLTVLRQMTSNKTSPIPQDNALANYAEKITKQEAQIDWKLSANKIERNLRAYNPFPIAYTFFEQQRIKIYSATIVNPMGEKSETEGEQQKIITGKIVAFNENGLTIACGEQFLQITCLQLPGKKPMQVAELINGYQDYFSIGSCFE